MQRARLWLAGSLLLTASCASAPALRQSVVAAPAVAPGITALAYGNGGEALWFSRQSGSGCSLQSVDLASGAAVDVMPLPFCPDEMRSTADAVVARAGSRSMLLVPAEKRAVQNVIAERSATNLVRSEDDRILWQHGEASTELPSGTRAVRYANDGEVIALAGSSSGDLILRVTPEGAPLTITTQESIDSFDVAPSGKELVFSAKRNGSYDVGLASTDGGEIHWIPSDPADETMVTWAPRGNKVTYVIRGKSGDFIRTVHVPSSFQLTVPFPLAMIHALSWEPKAERFAVVVSSIDKGPHVELLKYGGEEQKTIVPPAETIDSSVDQLRGATSTIFALPPKTIRYNQRYPVVMWTRSERAFGWSAATAQLRSNPQIGILFVQESELHTPDALRAAIASLPWADPSRLYVVGSADASAVGTEATVIRLVIGAGETGAVEAGKNRVTVRGPERSVVESLAARYIAEHVKG